MAVFGKEGVEREEVTKVAVFFSSSDGDLQIPF